jgi:polar amino acid transport system substrate-binding protein/glutamate/aspartate transport system substrate-binding protein
MRLLGALIAVVTLLPAWAGAQTLERVRDSGVFKIGFREDAAPYSYKNKIGQPAGYSVELCRAVATDVATEVGVAELAVDYVPVGADDRLAAVEEGRIDLLCGATTATLKRRERVDFSVPTFIDGAGVLLRNDGPPTFGDLGGQKVGVLGATTTEVALENTLQRQGVEAEVVVVGSHEDGLAKLEAGEITAYFADQAILIFLLSGSQAADDLKLGEGQFTLEPYALAMTRGDDDFRLAVDRSLSRLYRSGEVERIFKNSFGANASQSDLLRALYLVSGLPE